MNKKKVLFIMRNFHGGGAERVTIDVIKHLDKNVFEPIIYVMDNHGELTSSIPENIRVVSPILNGKKVFFPFKTIKSLIKTVENTDLIIGTLEGTPTYLSVIASYLKKKPAIGWVHIDVQHYPKTNSKIHKFLINRLYPKLKTIVVVSDGVKASFETMFPKINVPLKRIYNPVSISEINRMAEEPTDLNESPDPIFLGVGRLTDMKGFEYLIRAHKYLLDRHVKNKLLILGEGYYRDVLEEIIIELGVQDTVVLKGFVKNPYKYMKEADVFVLSSIYEGFAVVLAEAMAVGTPVVATDCPSGPAEILKDGEYGLLSSIRDYEGLAMNIIETLTADNEERKKERIQRAYDFSYQNIIPEFEKLFKQTFEENQDI